jgi:hypothetical protein
MADGPKARKSRRLDQHLLVAITIARLAGQVVAILHDWLSGGPGWPTNW